jgi:cell division septal protein FtsQ
VASGERARPGPRGPSRPASVVVPFPQERKGGGLARTRLVPSGRSILAAFALLAAAAAAYLIARETSVFAVRTVSVRGASPAVARQVENALRADLGTSLLRVDLGQAQMAVAALPTVAAVSFDRAFPHTLRVTILPERPVAVVREGASSWLVSARGRVMAVLQHGAAPRLPRIWVARGETFTVGAMVGGDLRPALEAVSPLGAVRFPARVSSVQTTGGELTLVLRNGIEVRLGSARDVALKLVVAANVLPLVSSDTRYVDVSVPERPVSGSRLASAALPATQSTAATSTTSGGSSTSSVSTTSPSSTTSPNSTATSGATATTSTAAAASTKTTTASTGTATLKSQVEGKVTTSTGP